MSSISDTTRYLLLAARRRTPIRLLVSVTISSPDRGRPLRSIGLDREKRRRRLLAEKSKSSCTSQASLFVWLSTQDRETPGVNRVLLGRLKMMVSSGVVLVSSPITPHGSCFRSESTVRGDAAYKTSWHNDRPQKSLARSSALCHIYGWQEITCQHKNIAVTHRAPRK